MLPVLCGRTTTGELRSPRHVSVMSPTPTRYEYFCGPTVVAGVLEISREEAARRLWAVTQSNGRSTHVGTIKTVLNEAGVEGKWEGCGSRFAITLKLWANTHREGTHIILAARHFVIVHKGSIVVDNNVYPRRGIVQQVFTIAGR